MVSYSNAHKTSAVWYSYAEDAGYIRVDEVSSASKIWFEVTEGESTRTEDQTGIGFAIQDSVLLSNSSCTPQGQDPNTFPQEVKIDIAVR